MRTAFPELAKDFDRKLAALRDSPDGVRTRALRAAGAQDYRACATAYESTRDRPAWNDDRAVRAGHRVCRDDDDT